MMKWIPNNKD